MADKLLASPLKGLFLIAFLSAFSALTGFLVSRAFERLAALLHQIRPGVAARLPRIERHDKGCSNFDLEKM